MLPRNADTCRFADPAATAAGASYPGQATGLAAWPGLSGQLIRMNTTS